MMATKKQEKVEVRGDVMCITSAKVDLQFGKTQVAMCFSKRSKIQRKLKLKEKDKVKVTIEKT